MGIKARTAVAALPLYKPAKNVERVRKALGLERVIKLAGNENTLGYSPKVDEALKNLTSRYPDGQAVALREKLGTRFGVGPEQIICGNGSFELILTIALAYIEEGEETILAAPSFNWYKNVTRIMGGTAREVPTKNFAADLDAMAEAVSPKTKIIWICNPNNPTGTMLTGSQLEEFLQKIPDDILVVLDEAYCGFVEDEGFPDSFALLKKYPNILILRSFSKLDGLANFRCGYAVGREDVIQNLNRVRIPINVTGPAQLAAMAAMDDPEFEEKTRRNVSEGRKLYYETLEKWDLPYVRSNANFMFFDILTDSKAVVEALEKKGILIRSGYDYGFPTMLRISIGTPEENRIVLGELGRILGKEI